MKIIKTTILKNQIKKLIETASFNLPSDITRALIIASISEKNATAKKILELIIKNSQIAARKKIPLCQDCGNTYIDIYIGKDICLENFSNIKDTVNQAVKEGYERNYLRKSIVSDPLFDRQNTNDNTPANLNIIPSNDLTGIKIEVSMKGGGSENCSFLFMLNPSDDKKIISDKVLESVKANATKSCPPLIIGIGIGSTSSNVTELARKAAFRNLEIKNSDARYRKLEEDILKQVNKTGIGPAGLGGKTTALAVSIEYMPCHMATLPIAIFLTCHSLRRASSKILLPSRS